MYAKERWTAARRRAARTMRCAAVVGAASTLAGCGVCTPNDPIVTCLGKVVIHCGERLRDLLHWLERRQQDPFRRPHLAHGDCDPDVPCATVETDDGTFVVWCDDRCVPVWISRPNGAWRRSLTRYLPPELRGRIPRDRDALRAKRERDGEPGRPPRDGIVSFTLDGTVHEVAWWDDAALPALPARELERRMADGGVDLDATTLVAWTGGATDGSTAWLELWAPPRLAAALPDPTAFGLAHATFVRQDETGAIAWTVLEGSASALAAYAADAGATAIAFAPPGGGAPVTVPLDLVGAALR